MRITNEQIRAEIICTQSDTCGGCPFYGVDNCDNLRGNDFNMYKDLLEARELIDKQEELIKEMRRFIARIGIYQLDDIDVGDRMSCLEKSKDYA